jgi:hypothetical protein
LDWSKFYHFFLLYYCFPFTPLVWWMQTQSSRILYVSSVYSQKLERTIRMFKKMKRIIRISAREETWNECICLRGALFFLLSSQYFQAFSFNLGFGRDTNNIPACYNDQSDRNSQPCYHYSIGGCGSITQEHYRKDHYD